MDKYKYHEMGGLWYELKEDFYFPCLTLPESESKPIELWGQRHKCYLQEHRKIVYTKPLTSGKPNSYLPKIYKQAEEMYHRLIEEMAERQGVTKSSNQSSLLN